MGVVDGESVEENDWIVIRNVVAVDVGDEDELGCTGRKDSSVADFKS